MKKIKLILSKVMGDKLFSFFINLKTSLFEMINKKKLLQSRNAFYASFINSNDVCFDVGANIGNRTESMLAIGAKVIAVEPQKSCIAILEKKFGESITIVPKGLGKEPGFLDMFIATNTTISSFSKDWIDKVKQDRFSEYSWNKTEKIEVTTLDTLIDTYGKPQFIKIDVEGFELEVLKGLSQSVRYVSIEYNVPDNIENTVNCLLKLQQLNANAVCNYSVGESMQWALQQWMPIGEMLNYVKSDVFIRTSFGDLYIQS